MTTELKKLETVLTALLLGNSESFEHREAIIIVHDLIKNHPGSLQVTKNAHGQICEVYYTDELGCIKERISESAPVLEPVPQEPAGYLKTKDTSTGCYAEQFRLDKPAAYETAEYIPLYSTPQATVIQEQAILNKFKYHLMEANPAIEGDVDDFELFDPSISCGCCVDVFIIRADAVQILKPT